MTQGKRFFLHEKRTRTFFTYPPNHFIKRTFQNIHILNRSQCVIHKFSLASRNYVQFYISVNFTFQALLITDNALARFNPVLLYDNNTFLALFLCLQKKKVTINSPRYIDSIYDHRDPNNERRGNLAARELYRVIKRQRNTVYWHSPRAHRKYHPSVFVRQHLALSIFRIQQFGNLHGKKYGGS